MTIFNMERLELITKEEMENYCIEKWNRKDNLRISVNDDLDSFLEDLRLGKFNNPIFSYFWGSKSWSSSEEKVDTYFLPKLTEKELELVERKDPSYERTFYWDNPDVSEYEMKLSESDSKFIHIRGCRRTFTIEPYIEIENFDDFIKLVSDCRKRRHSSTIKSSQ